MAKLIVRNPQRAKLKTTGFIGQPEGDIVLSENNKTTNVSSFATATVRVPEPTGTLLITENGEQIDIKDKEFVDVAVPEPIIDNTGIDLLSLEEHKGYRKSDGSISGNGTDPNWSWFDPVNIGERKMVLYRLWGYTTVMSLMVWNADEAIIDTVHIASGSGYFSGKYTIPNGGTRIAVSCFNTIARADQICVLI